jgi:hypothetical protein
VKPTGEIAIESVVVRICQDNPPHPTLTLESNGLHLIILSDAHFAALGH